MRAFILRIKELKPILILLYLSATGFLCMLSAERYLHLGLQLPNCLSFMGIIFGVYTLNRYTDTAEDFTNDIGRLVFFEKRKAFLILACVSLAASVGFLLISEKLNWVHCLLLMMGFSYSYRIIPWYSTTEGFRLLRIKEMTLLKNLSVSFLWGASVFVVPILYSGTRAFDAFQIGLLAAGLFISTLNNTLFDDILDEPGDRVAGIKTLPAIWGGRNSQVALLILDSVWVASILALLCAHRVDIAHAAFLSFLGLYPFAYIGLNIFGKASKGLVDLLSEADLFFFALGMLLLGLR